jgi:hypothetical protein
MLDIKAHFKLQKNRVLGSNVHFTVIVLKDRLLFVRTDGRFENASDKTSASAIVGGAIGMMIDTAGQSSHHASSGIEERLNKLNYLIEERILSADPANFTLRFEEISAVRILRAGRSLTQRSGIVKIETVGARDQKYDIPAATDFSKTSELLEGILGAKFSIE